MRYIFGGGKLLHLYIAIPPPYLPRGKNDYIAIFPEGENIIIRLQANYLFFFNCNTFFKYHLFCIIIINSVKLQINCALSRQRR